MILIILMHATRLNYGMVRKATWHFSSIFFNTVDESMKLLQFLHADSLESRAWDAGPVGFPSFGITFRFGHSTETQEMTGFQRISLGLQTQRK